MQQDRADISNATRNGLLGPGDPDPIGIVNPDSTGPILLVCEHGGQAVPQALGTLGVGREELDSHIGWDVGALPVANAVAHSLGAPLIHQRYSRLVYDCNRPPDSPETMPHAIHGSLVPGNRDLTEAQIAQRRNEIFNPYDAALRTHLDIPRRAAFAIHSFTPELDGQVRPWSVGLLSRNDDSTADALSRSLGASAPDALIAQNEPYRIEDDSDWFIPQHAERLDLAHCLIEIRNDLLATPQGRAIWAARLANAIRAVMEDPT